MAGVYGRRGRQMRWFFFFNDTATTEIYTLSLHDALPIFDPQFGMGKSKTRMFAWSTMTAKFVRSEEHTSELQSRLHLVCRLLLEKKKTATSLTHAFPRRTGCRRSESQTSSLH